MNSNVFSPVMITTNSEGGWKIFIRPFKHEDTPLFTDMFNALSKESIYSRFFSSIKSVPYKLLEIDYDHNIALIAMSATQPEEKMLGIAHLICNFSGKEAETAVLVSDTWQGKGIGTALMKQLINIAQKRGVETLWGLVLIENIHTIALGQKLGFSFSLMSGVSEYEFHNCILLNATLNLLNNERV